MPVPRRHIVGIGTLAILAIAGCGSSSSSTVASSSAASAKPSSSPAPISFPNVALGSTEIPGYTQIVNKPLTGCSPKRPPMPPTPRTPASSRQL